MIMDESRLASLEGKIDKILNRMEVVARLEERQISTANLIERNKNRLDVHEERITDLETDTRGMQTSASIMERGYWIIFSAIVGFIMYFSKGK